MRWPTERYGVILADPPWGFVNWSDKGIEKGAEKQYRCMDTNAIKELRHELGLDFICLPDAALIMWATFPMLPDAFSVMEAWGFQYKTGGAWGKTTKHNKLAFGTGYIYRGAAEIWLLGVRGAPHIKSRSIRNLIIAERREHSRKPDQMYEDIEALFNGPYLELFARNKRREGWDKWGNEVGKFDA
jgi:N6-adenosine-specific RNA methylase IME4